MVVRRWKIILICLTLLVAAVLSLKHKSEPTYQGRSLDAWIDYYAATPLMSRYDERNREFWKALHKAGTNALPYVVRSLARNDSTWYKKYCEWQLKLPKFLKKLTPPPKPLMQAMDGELAITYLGTNSIPYVITLLKHKSPTVRQVAASVLVGFRMQTPAAKQAIPALIEALDDPNPNVCSSAVSGITLMGSDASNAVPALSKIVVDGRTNSFFWFNVRSRAASALGNIGPPAREALPELKRALQESSSLAASLRCSAAVAIWRIDKDVKTAMPVLLHEMPGVGEHKQEDWIDALAEMVPRAKEALPQLQDELKSDNNPWVRAYVTNPLLKSDPAALSAQKTNN
jgi:HEAT repeats/PBS lyase HEAT-like repeat